MNRALLIGLALFTLLGVCTPVEIALAAPDTSGRWTTSKSDSTPCNLPDDEGLSTCYDTQTGNQGVSVDKDGNPFGLGDVLGKGLGPLYNALIKASLAFASWLAVVILQVALFLLALTGVLVDLFLWISLNMGMWMGRTADGITPVGQIIKESWVIFRDLGNLVLIAGLIWASIAMILQINAGTQKPGNLIANVLIVALLVNFSYFFAGALIDGSNALSKIIFDTGISRAVDRISVGQGVGGVVGAVGTNPLSRNSRENSALSAGTQKLLDDLSIKVLGFKVDKPFAGVFLQQTRLGSILDSKYLAKNVEKNATFFIFITTAVTLLTMAIYVFLRIIVMMVVRIVLLIILLVTSPVMILRFTRIGELEEWGKQWWSSLIGQLVFLPVFMLLVMIAFNVTGAFTESGYLFASMGGTAKGSLGALFDGGAGTANGIMAILNFFLALGLLWGSIRIAKNIATETQTKLPKAGDLQQLASQGAEPAAKWLATKGVQSPRLLLQFFGKQMTDFAGPKLRDATRGGRLEELGWRLKLARSRLPLGGPSTEEVRRQMRHRTEWEDKATDALEDVAYWKAQLKAAKTPAERRTAEQGLEDAKNKLKRAYQNLYKAKGAVGVADFIAANNLSEDQVDGLLESLEEKEAAEVSEQLKRRGYRAPKGKKGAAGSDLGGSNAGGERDESAGGGSGGPQLTVALRELGDRLVSSSEATRAQAHRDFATLEYDQQRLIIIERRELHTAQHMESLAKAVGPERFAQHIADMPARMIAIPEVRAGIAPHMTPESYAKLRERLINEGKEHLVFGLNQELAKHEETRTLADDYEKTQTKTPNV